MTDNNTEKLPETETPTFNDLEQFNLDRTEELLSEFKPGEKVFVQDEDELV